MILLHIKNANANKSWFMFGNKIVVLGSDIHDELHRDVTTTIDNRMSDVNEKTNVSAMDKDGKAVVYLMVPMNIFHGFIIRQMKSTQVSDIIFLKIRQLR